QESVELNLFALKAANVDGCEIVSDYAVVFPIGLDSIELVNINELLPTQAETEEYHHVLTVDSCANVYDAADSHRDAYLYYDGSLDLKKVVSLFELDYLNDAIANYGFEVEYTFSDEKVFNGQDNNTDQNKFVKLDGSVLSVDKEFLKANPQGGRAAIGRTPLIFVEAKIAGVVVDTASIKIEITEKEVVMPEPIVIEVGPESFEYSDIVEDSVVMDLPWEQFNQEAYEVLTLTPAEFWAIYTDSSSVVPNGVVLGYQEPTEEGAPTSTDIANIAFDPYEIQLGKDSAILILHPNSPLYKDIVVKFHYSISHDPKFPALNDEYLLDETTTVEGEANETVQVKGKLWTIDNVERWALRSEMKEFCEDYLAHWADSMPGNHEDLTFEIVGKVVDGELVTEDLGAELTATDYISSEIYLTKPLGEDDPTEASRIYQVKMNQVMFNGDTCSKVFCVKFIRPFEITVDPLVLKTYQAIPDSAHVDSAVVVKDLDGKVLYADCKVTEYAETYYKFTQEMFDNGLSYELAKLDNTWGFEDGEMKLKLVNDADGNPTILEWYNGGGDLQKNKETSVTVTLVLEELATAAVDGKVTVLSTANSK
ncbi:MAG: hypothetical protein IJB58_05515, partial [Bacteroidales bacterium]|nr:hypothetical protein [Bacteroidales bacterium]